MDESIQRLVRLEELTEKHISNLLNEMRGNDINPSSLPSVLLNHSIRHCCSVVSHINNNLDDPMNALSFAKAFMAANEKLNTDILLIINKLNKIIKAGDIKTSDSGNSIKVTSGTVEDLKNYKDGR